MSKRQGKKKSSYKLSPTKIALITALVDFLIEIIKLIREILQ